MIGFKGSSSARLQIAAALDALRFNNPDTTSLARFDDHQWQAFLSFCDRAQLALPMAHACVHVAPNWVRARFVTNLTDNTLRVAKLKAAYREMASALAQAHAKHLVVKGFAQTPDFTPDAALRMQSDIDLYCPPDHITAARDALQRLGYRPEPSLKDFPADHLPVMSRQSDWHWRDNFYDPEMPPSVDLHFCLWNASATRLRVSGVEAFWSRREIRIQNDFHFAALSTVDNLAFCALHVLRDLLREDWVLHHVYEIAYFLHLHAQDTHFWQMWLDLHDPQLRSLQLIAFSLARSWFACDMPDTLEEEMRRLPAPLRQWLSSFSQSPLESMYRANKDALWLHLSLLDSRRDRAAMFCSQLLPLRIPAIGAPGQNTDRFHRVRRRWPSQPHLRYALHLLFRLGFHLGVVPRTLFRGLGWWLSQKQLGKGFWTFFAASFFFDLGFSIYFFLYNLFLLGFGFRERSLGLFTTAMSVGGIAGSVPAGMLLRRFGIVRVLLGCFLIASFLATCRAVFLAFPVQLGLAFFGGIALSVWAVSLSPTVAALVPEKSRPFAFSLIFSAGIGIGSLGALLGGVLPAWITHLGAAISPLQAERCVLLLSCAIVVVGALFIVRMRVPAPPLKQAGWARPSRFLLRYLPCIAVWSLVTGSFAPFASIYFARQFHMPLQHIGAVFSISQMVQVGGILAAPLLFRRFGVLQGIMLTQLTTAFSLLCLSSAHVAAAAIAVYMTYMAAQWMSEPGMYTLLMNEAPAHERSDAAALNFLVISSFQAIAATAAGVSLSRFGYTAVLAAIAAVGLAAALLFRLLLRDRTEVAQLSPVGLTTEEPSPQ